MVGWLADHGQKSVRIDRRNGNNDKERRKNLHDCCHVPFSSTRAFFTPGRGERPEYPLISSAGVSRLVILLPFVLVLVSSVVELMIKNLMDVVEMQIMKESKNARNSLT